MREANERTRWTVEPGGYPCPPTDQHLDEAAYHLGLKLDALLVRLDLATIDDTARKEAVAAHMPEGYVPDSSTLTARRALSDEMAAYRRSGRLPVVVRQTVGPDARVNRPGR